MSHCKKHHQRFDACSECVAELKQIIVDQEIHAGDLEQHITDLEQKLAAANAEIARLKGTETYGCHLDLEPGQKTDRCVIDEGTPNECDRAMNLIREGKTKLNCRYWRIIQTDKLR